MMRDQAILLQLLTARVSTTNSLSSSRVVKLFQGVHSLKRAEARGFKGLMPFDSWMMRQGVHDGNHKVHPVQLKSVHGRKVPKQRLASPTRLWEKIQNERHRHVSEQSQVCL